MFDIGLNILFNSLCARKFYRKYYVEKYNIQVGVFCFWPKNVRFDNILFTKTSIFHIVSGSANRIIESRI